MKSKGLGRGLDALFSESASQYANNTNQVVEVAIGDIDPNSNQPRKHFDHQSLEQLAESISQTGVLQPILLVKDGERYQILAGERRWRAARLAGLLRIPSLIRDADQVSRLEIALIENLQREDLNPIEEAAAVRSLMDECGLTQDAVSKRLGRSRPAIANLLRLLTLPQQIQDMVVEGKLSAGHARALAAIDSRTRQIQLAQLAVDQDLSVRQIEVEASRREKQQKPGVVQPAEFEQIENRAREAFGLRVSLKGTLKKGKIILSYGDQSELENFLDILEGVR